MNINELAFSVANDIHEAKEFEYDTPYKYQFVINPLFLEIIVDVIKLLLQRCNKPSIKDVNSPNLLQRWTLKRVVKKAVSDKGGHYNAFGDRIVKELLKKGTTLTREDLKSLLQP